jgi:hypothetical protein
MCPTKRSSQTRTEVKAPANRYEVGYHRELAGEPEADLTPQEFSDNGIDLVI